MDSAGGENTAIGQTEMDDFEGGKVSRNLSHEHTSDFVLS